jgi:hypothetical protein
MYRLIASIHRNYPQRLLMQVDMVVPTGALVIQMARDSQQTHGNLIAVPRQITDPK